eukprot:1921791-Pleurochrysis_carterae.AAC.1
MRSLMKRSRSDGSTVRARIRERMCVHVCVYVCARALRAFTSVGCARPCVHACVRAYVLACVRACACARALERRRGLQPHLRRRVLGPAVPAHVVPRRADAAEAIRKPVAKHAIDATLHHVYRREDRLQRAVRHQRVVALVVAGGHDRARPHRLVLSLVKHAQLPLQVLIRVRETYQVVERLLVDDIITQVAERQLECSFERSALNGARGVDGALDALRLVENVRIVARHALQVAHAAFVVPKRRRQQRRRRLELVHDHRRQRRPALLRMRR